MRTGINKGQRADDAGRPGSAGFPDISGYPDDAGFPAAPDDAGFPPAPDDAGRPDCPVRPPAPVGRAGGGSGRAGVPVTPPYNRDRRSRWDGVTGQPARPASLVRAVRAFSGMAGEERTWARGSVVWIVPRRVGRVGSGFEFIDEEDVRWVTM
jgi:hypothetical protein